MDTASEGIVIKKAENIDATAYSKIPDLMRLTSDVLNPNKIKLVRYLPAIECELDGLNLSAKITKKRSEDKKQKPLKDHLHKINENSDIQQMILQAEENGELNANSRNKLKRLLRKPDYKNLPIEGRKELISECLTIKNQNNDPHDELLAFISAKYNPNEKSIETSVNIVIELINNLTNLVSDTLKTSSENLALEFFWRNSINSSMSCSFVLSSFIYTHPPYKEYLNTYRQSTFGLFVDIADF